MADEKKELILSVGFDLDRAEERKLKANLDKATGELEKQQREAKQLSQTLDELNKKREQLDKKHTERSQEIKANNASRENYKAEIDRANELRKEVVKLTSELKSMPDYDLFEADKEKVKALKDELKSMSKDSPQYDVFKQQVEAVTADFEKKYELYIQKDMELEKKKQAYNKADRAIVSHFNSENINTGDLKQLESELDEVNAKIGETEKKLGDVNAKINVTTANVEVAREKLKKAHIPKSIKESANGLDRFGKRIKGLVKQAFIFGVIAKGLRTMVGYMGELLKSTPEYAEQLSQIKGNLMVTASSLWTALEPAISWLLSALNYLTQVLAVGVSTMLGQTREEAIEAAKAFDRLTKSSKKSTASLDTLHKLGDSSIMSSYEALENIDEDKWAELAETFNFILRIVRSIGTALLIWKIASSVLGFFSDLKTLGFKNGMLALQLTLAADLIWDGIKDLTDGDTGNDLWGMLKTSIGAALAAAGIAGMIGISSSAALLITLPATFLLSYILGWKNAKDNGMFDDIYEKRDESIEKINEKFEKMKEENEDMSWLYDAGKTAAAASETYKSNQKINRRYTASLFGVNSSNLPFWEAFEKYYEKDDGEAEGIKDSNESLEETNGELSDNVAKMTAAMERLNRFAPLSVPHIPKLATGTIIPPNNPYLAVVGDQRSGTNVEAPLETIVEAMRIALREQGSGRDITVVMEYDGREFGRAVYHANNEETQRVGVRLAKA